ncbi:MAG: hypothetical protein ACTSXU_05725 [Promethearchaeota archaeon]
MPPRNEKEEKKIRYIEDLLSIYEVPRSLTELLDRIMEEEFLKVLKLKQKKKNQMIRNLIDASKIYEKMPLERLAIKLDVDINEVLDLLEEVLLNGECEGIIISGNEIIFKNIPKFSDFTLKPVVLINPKSGNNLEKNIQFNQGIRTIPEAPQLTWNNGDLEQSGYILKKEKVEKTRVLVNIKLKSIGAVLLSIIEIKNPFKQSLSKISIKIKTSNNLKLLRTIPNFNLDNRFRDEFHLIQLMGKSTRKLKFYFSPVNKDPFKIDVLLKYIDPAGQEI